jgi:hypothetical protein
MACCNVISLSEVRSGFRIDSEFYRRDFVAADHELAKLPLKGIGSCAKVTDGEHGSVKLTLSGVKYLTAENVKQGYVDAERVRYVGAEVDERNARARVREGDVLVSIKGTLGEIGLAEKELLPANMNRDVAIIKVHSHINGGYLTAFLRSRFGAYQLAREGSGGVQQMITLGRLRNVQVAVLPQSAQDEVAIIQAAGLENRRQSKRLYADAERLLEEELGLDRLSFLKPVGYTACFSDLETSHRSDSQHYQPRFKQLIDHIKGFPSARVRDIRSFNRRGLQPTYLKNGDVDVVNSQHLGPKHIDYDGLEKTSAKSFAAAPEAHIQQDDLLIYTTGAYIGRTNVYLSNAPAMASNHVNILRLQPGIDAAYMALVFQSIVGQFQTQQHARGSAQAELYPSDIDRFVVPLIDMGKQKAIGDLVCESLVKQKQSRQLLEQAKTRVEQLIEEAIQP